MLGLREWFLRLRDQRGLPWLEDLGRDFRYALRLASRQPRFSLTIVATTALAIGLSTALFSVVDATLLRPLPYQHAEELMDAQVGFELQPHRLFYGVATSDIRRWRGSNAIAGAAGWRYGPDSVLAGAVPVRATARDITEGYFGVYGVTVSPGRDFTTADTAIGAAPVVIVSHALWQMALGGDAGAIGRLIRYGDVAAEVVGVAPAGFQPDVSIWRPALASATTVDFRAPDLESVLRVKAGTKVDDVARQLSAMTPVGERRSAAGGSGALGAPVRLKSMRDGEAARHADLVALLGAAVALIVLIACVNIAGLLFARGATRTGEMAIRASLGAGRSRLVRQLLIESLALAIAGGAAGVLLASISLDGLLAILPIRLQPGTAVSINARVLIAAAMAATATGIAFGLVPAMSLSRARIGHAGRLMDATFPRRRGQWLMATEIALTVALLAGAGLMTRSFARLLSVDLGFDPGAVIAFKALPVGTDPAAQTQCYQDLLRAVRAVPGVAYAGAVDLFALGDARTNNPITVNGRLQGASVRQFLPGYFEAMGLRLLAGSFPGATGDAVVNASAARALFGRSAVGGAMVVNNVPLTVVGVVADVYESGPMHGPAPEVLVPFVPPKRRSISDHGLTIVVRPRPGAPNLTPALRAAAASIGPRAILGEPRRGDAWLSDLVATPRHQTTLVALLGVFGLALTLVGVFSTTAYAVERRTQEIGVRMALGADASRVVRTIMRDAGRPLVIGLAAGTLLAFYATRLVQSFLFQTSPHDPATFAVAAGVLALTAMAAAWWPARRAARVDPVAALRAE